LKHEEDGKFREHLEGKVGCGGGDGVRGRNGAIDWGFGLIEKLRLKLFEVRI
jgi:hypothetical protein